MLNRPFSMCFLYLLRITHEFKFRYRHLWPADNPVRPLGPKFIEMIQKHLPMLRIPEYGLARAARHLEDWIHGRLPVEDLHDVSACLGLKIFQSFGSLLSFRFAAAPASSEPVGRTKFKPQTLEQKVNSVQRLWHRGICNFFLFLIFFVGMLFVSARRVNS